jgi:hypothetical protein
VQLQVCERACGRSRLVDRKVLSYALADGQIAIEC